VIEDMPRIDANGDGFIMRAEAQSAAGTMFDRLDTNRDGKLDSADRPQRRMVVHREVRRDGATVEESVTEDAEGQPGERREVRRHVIVKDGKEHGRRGHHGRHGPPMGLMIFAHAGEADSNGDGAVSRQEHIAQQLRFFDAADVNGDGKIKFDPPPMPPVPPAVQPPEAPPAPPPPPRR
jgi:hypothetical protein